MKKFKSTLEIVGVIIVFYFLIIAPLILLSTDLEKLLWINSDTYFVIWVCLFTLIALMTDADIAMLILIFFACWISPLSWLYLCIGILIVLVKEYRKLSADTDGEARKKIMNKVIA